MLFWLKFSKPDIERTNQLADNASTGLWSEQEKAELGALELVGHQFSVLKSRAGLLPKPTAS
jgi:hypothetical protein